MATCSTTTTTMATSVPIMDEKRDRKGTTTTTGPEEKRSSNGVHQDRDQELYQDVISQFPLLNGYSHGLLGFKIGADTSHEAVVAVLRTALKKMTDQIPWLGGQMARRPDGKAGFSDVYVPAAWPAAEEEAGNEMVRVKDCSHLLPPMAQIVRAGAPISMLQGDILTPWPSLPMPHGLQGALPVIALQANLVKGGLLLTVSPHHMAMDGVGFVHFLKLLACSIRGVEMTAVELEQANRDRSRVVQLIPRGEPVKDYSHLRRPAGWTPKAPLSKPQWCYFKMPVAALSTLRKVDSAGQQQQQLVSDNDMVCAFCWQRISAVRLARGLSPTTPVKFSRAIDGRGAVGVPSSYMGHMAHHAIAQLPLGQVVSMPLSGVAQTLRRALNAVNTNWATRSYATFVAREPDKSALMYGGLRDVNLDLGATSFISNAGEEREAGSAMADDDFGPLLGRVCFLRRPWVSPLTSTITVSSAEGGAMPICLCLPEDDLEALKKDKEWRRYTRYLG